MMSKKDQKVGIFVEDLSADDLHAIEKRMQPGGVSYSGFLAEDEKLGDVIAKDNATLKDLGVTHKQVADRIESIFGRALRRRALEFRYRNYKKKPELETALIDGKFKVDIQGYLGIQVCPFKEPLKTCGTSNHDVEIYNQDLEEDIEFPGLIVHLIREHHFFEGDTYYRLDPAKAVRVLEIEPDVDYSPKWETEKIWQGTNSTPDLTKDFLGSFEFRETAERSIQIASGVLVYLNGDKGLLVTEDDFELEAPVSIDDATLVLHTWHKGQVHLELLSEKYISA